MTNGTPLSIVGSSADAVVKLLSKRWWIAIGATPKLEPEGPRAEWGSRPRSIQGTLFGFYGIYIVFEACNIYLHQARTNANDREGLHFIQNIMHTEKYSNINCAEW